MESWLLNPATWALYLVIGLVITEVLRLDGPEDPSTSGLTTYAVIGLVWPVVLMILVPSFLTIYLYFRIRQLLRKENKKDE